MRILKAIATLMSLAVAVLGLVGVFAPEALLSFGRLLLAPPALYAVAVARVVFGVLLIAVAARSRVPRALRVLGSFIVVAGLITPFFAVERFGGVVVWLSERPTLVRVFALVPLLLGLLLIYVINTNRKVAA